MHEPLHNRREYLNNRKNLRNNPTPAEAMLWRMLSGKRFSGRKFRRQHSIGNYIVDFYCASERLIIELDGAGHFDYSGIEADLNRDENLRSLGFTVLRFENQFVTPSIDSVMQAIEDVFGK